MAARYITRVGILLALTLAIQLSGLPQPLTGPATNALFLLTVIVAGPAGAALIGMMVPWVGLSRGILPPALAPAIPFIMVGNAALVLIFWLVASRFGSGYKGAGAWAGVITGAVTKWAILIGAVEGLLHLPLKVSAGLGVAQLLNALLGGVVALLAVRALEGARLLTARQRLHG